MPWDAAAALNARNIRSAIFWDVSVVQPTVAAVLDGDRIVFSGQITLMGVRQPWFNGMSDEIIDRRQYCFY